jgi:hypothetical protein
MKRQKSSVRSMGMIMERNEKLLAISHKLLANRIDMDDRFLN